MTLDITFFEALAAGLLSFVSPCVLPLVPIFSLYLASTAYDRTQASDSGPWHLCSVTVAALCAFVSVFVALGSTGSAMGQALSAQVQTLSTDLGSVIVLVGLSFLGGPWALVPSLLRALAFGAALAFAWTPCVGPTLSKILFLTGAPETIAQGAPLLATYAGGIVSPFLVAALVMAGWRRKRSWTPTQRPALRPLASIAVAWALALAGVLIIHGVIRNTAYAILEWVPALGTIG